MSAEDFPDEGRLPSFGRATAWLNSEPLTAAAIEGRVVLVDFWTYTCVNWLRTLPYLRAWHRKYRDAGLIIVGVHTPEFGFEAELGNVITHSRELGVQYPIAVDADYGVWDEFANHYWPAVYLADAAGRIRYHHSGEGEYANTELAIPRLTADAGATNIDLGLVAPEPAGLEVPADPASLRSPETYLGYGQSSGFASDDPRSYDRSRTYLADGRLPLNSWDLSGVWTVARHAAILDSAGGRIAFDFHARDVNLIMAPVIANVPVPFRVFLDGQPVGEARGSDVGADGRGVVDNSGVYQLIRQPGQVGTRLFEIEFLEHGVEAYCFTFG